MMVMLSWCLNFLPLFHQHCTCSAGNWFKSFQQKINIHQSSWQYSFSIKISYKMWEEWLMIIWSNVPDKLYSTATSPATIFYQNYNRSREWGWHCWFKYSNTSSVLAPVTMTTQHKHLKVLSLLSLVLLHSVDALFFRQNPPRGSRNMDTDM